MRVVSTQLKMTDQFTTEKFFEVVLRWLKGGNPYLGVAELFEACEKKESTHKVCDYCTLETWAADKNEAHYQLLKLSHIYYGQTWDTEVIFEDRGVIKYVFVHVDCTGDTTQFDDVPVIRSAVIREFVNSGMVEQGELPIQCSPIDATFQNQQLIVDAINGKHRLSLPMVFVTKVRNTQGYDVDPESMALQLGGIAYVVQERDEDFSFGIRDLTNNTNPYGGYIGIYYMDGKSKTYYKGRNLVKPLDRTIIEDVVRAHTAKVDHTAPTWAEFYKDKLEREVQESIDLMNDTIDENGSLEEQLSREREKVRGQAKELLQLRARVESLQAAVTAKEGETFLVKSPIEEWFEGEQNDLLVGILQRALRDAGRDTRTYELLSSLLSVNKEKGAGKAIFERIKTILSSGENLTERDFSELHALGFEVTADNTHYRLLFRGNELYKFTLPKTPSDHREGKNSVSDITKRLSVYKK